MALGLAGQFGKAFAAGLTVGIVLALTVAAFAILFPTALARAIGCWGSRSAGGGDDQC